MACTTGFGSGLASNVGFGRGSTLGFGFDSVFGLGLGSGFGSGLDGARATGALAGNGGGSGGATSDATGGAAAGGGSDTGAAPDAPGAAAEAAAEVVGPGSINITVTGNDFGGAGGGGAANASNKPATLRWASADKPVVAACCLNVGPMTATASGCPEFGDEPDPGETVALRGGHHLGQTLVGGAFIGV